MLSEKYIIKYALTLERRTDSYFKADGVKMKSTCHSDWKNRKGLDIEHVSKQFADLEIYSSTLHTLSYSKDTERTPV